MRSVGVVVLIASALGAASGARAEVEYPYCLVPSLFTVGTCTYATYEQCAASASGNVGFCSRNPRYVATLPPRQARPRN
jgi:hypothetical protein